MDPLIKVSNIAKIFHINDDDQLALQDISFDVGRGEFVCIVGPSGCGKSTLLRIMSKLSPPSSGSVSMEDGLKLSMVFQNFALFPWLTVADNIGYGLLMNGESPAVRARKVKKLVEEMGLYGMENKHPKELSGGMKQRVGIARALAINPDVLFLDEPFSSLDVFTANKLRRDLLSIWRDQKLTVVMVSHLIEEAIELADKIIVLSANPGRIQLIEEVKLTRPRNTRSDKFYEYVDKIQGMIVV